MRIFVMKLYILGFFILILILTSCVVNHTATELNGHVLETQNQNVFDARKVNVGDTINNLIISSLNVTTIDTEEYYASVKFIGEIKLSGVLNIFDPSDGSSEGWGLGNFFQPAKESNIKVPVLNYESTRTGFTIEDNTVGQLKELGPGTYEVLLIVDEYEIWSLGKGQENKAKLFELIELKKLN